MLSSIQLQWVLSIPSKLLNVNKTSTPESTTDPANVSEKQRASLEKPCHSVSRKESFQSTIMFNLLRLKTSSLVCFGDWDMLDLLPNQDAIVANYGVFAWDSLLTL